MCNNLITSLLKTIHVANEVSSPCFGHYIAATTFISYSLSMVAYLQHTHEHQSDCNNKCSVVMLKIVETSGKIISKGDIGMA